MRLRAGQARFLMRRPRRLTAALSALLLLWSAVLGFQIVATGKRSSAAPADAAIVLGAAVYGERPSPVFEERIRHGIALLKAKRVQRLIFTGGYGKGAETAEALVARNYALAAGVPEQKILTETASRTTLQNLREARRLIDKEKLSTVLLVTDPLHMKRALRMCEGIGMACLPSPTPTSRYRTWRSKAGFLLREIYFYNVYLIAGQ